MIAREGGAHPGEAFAEASGLLDGHAAPPSEEVPAHLVDLPGASAAMARARVVLPHWRGPVRATAGRTENASRIRARAVGQSVIMRHKIP